MGKTDETYVDLSGRVTPATMRELRAYHAERIRGGGKPVTFTATVREVIAAGLAALSRARDSRNTSSPDEREVA